MTETGLSLGKERLERFFWENNHKDATVADDERLRAQAALAIFKKKCGERDVHAVTHNC